MDDWTWLVEPLWKSLEPLRESLPQVQRQNQTQEVAAGPGKDIDEEETDYRREDDESVRRCTARVLADLP